MTYGSARYRAMRPRGKRMTRKRARRQRTTERHRHVLVGSQVDHRVAVAVEVERARLTVDVVRRRAAVEADLERRRGGPDAKVRRRIDEERIVPDVAVLARLVGAEPAVARPWPRVEDVVVDDD